MSQIPKNVSDVSDHNKLLLTGAKYWCFHWGRPQETLLSDSSFWFLVDLVSSGCFNCWTILHHIVLYCTFLFCFLTIWVPLFFSLYTIYKQYINKYALCNNVTYLCSTTLCILYCTWLPIALKCRKSNVRLSSQAVFTIVWNLVDNWETKCDIKK